jgi:predicted nuclease of predicted toxin-antitoxin system
MRLLLDQNLSHRLIDLLEDLFPGSLHVRILGLAEADDLTIWNHAKEHGLVIVTQDSDYADWNKLRGAPPRIIWLRCGNASVEQIHLKIRNAADRIALLNHADAEVEIVEIW